MSIARRLPRSGTAAFAFGVLLTAAACAKSVPTGTVSPSRGGIPLEVSDRASRPRLARLTRQGDPSSAVALAIANTGEGAGATLRNQALALLFAERLARRGLPVVAASDDLGVRMTRTAETPEQASQIIMAMREVLAAPVTDEEALALRHSLEASPPRRLAPAEAGIAACAGDAGVAPTSKLPETSAQAVETWRSESLQVGGVAVGIVGPNAVSNAATETIDGGAAWSLRPARTGGRATAPSHRVAFAALEHDASSRLEIAWDLPDPRRALELAVALRARPSPLREKLSLREPRWRLAEVFTTARMDGGCLRLRFESRDLPRGHLAQSAAEVIALAEHDVAAGLAWPPNDAIVAETIAAAEEATSAAERAAWWALSAPRKTEGIVVSSLLSLPPQRDDIEGTLDELEAAYQSEIAAGKTHEMPVRPRDLASTAKHSLEPGQRESWLLVANECGSGDESAWDAGRSALAAQTAAEFHVGDDVTIEPWIRPDGIGLLAHGAPRSPESAVDFGRRLARGLGAALASASFSEARFNRAHATALRFAANPEVQLLGALGQRAFPDRPTLFAPLGLLDQQLATTRRDAEERWRGMLSEPWRMAMLASVDGDEAHAAERELARWFVGPASSPCARKRAADGPGPGETRVAAAQTAARALTAFTTGSAQDASILEVVAALVRQQRGDSAVSARSLGGTRAPTLVLDTGARPLDLEAELERLRKLEVSPKTFQAAVDQVLHERKLRRATPRGRIDALWLADEHAPPGLEDVRRWIHQNFQRARAGTAIAVQPAPSSESTGNAPAKPR